MVKWCLCWHLSHFNRLQLNFSNLNCCNHWIVQLIWLHFKITIDRDRLCGCCYCYCCCYCYNHCASFICYIGGKLKLKDFILYHIYWMCNFRSFSFQRHINGMKAKSLTALDNDHYFTLVVNLPIKEMDIFDVFFFILTYEYTLQFGQIKQKLLKKQHLVICYA